MVFFRAYALLLVFTSHVVCAQSTYFGRNGMASMGWEFEGWHFEKYDSEGRILTPPYEPHHVSIDGYWGKGGSVKVPATIDGLPVTEVSMFPQSKVAGVNRQSPEPVTELTVPGSIRTINRISLPMLTNVIIGDGVQELGGNAFEKSTNLQSVKIPGSLTNWGDFAFSKLASLTNVVLGEGLAEIGAGAFSRSGITSVVIPRGVTKVSVAAFYECGSLTNVFIPGTVKLIEGNAFVGCSNLTTLIIEEGVENIGNSAFRGCAKLESVVVPESFKGYVSDQFADCPSLTNVTLPRHLQDFISIEKFGFNDKLEAELLRQSKAAGLYWPDSKKSPD